MGGLTSGDRCAFMCSRSSACTNLQRLSSLNLPCQNCLIQACGKLQVFSRHCIQKKKIISSLQWRIKEVRSEVQSKGIGKNISRGEATEKRPKIALLSFFQGRGWKKDRKIAKKTEK